MYIDPPESRKFWPWGTCRASCGWFWAPREAPPPESYIRATGADPESHQVHQVVWGSDKFRGHRALPEMDKRHNLTSEEEVPWKSSPCQGWSVVCCVSHDGLFVPGRKIINWSPIFFESFWEWLVHLLWIIANSSPSELAIITDLRRRMSTSMMMLNMLTMVIVVRVILMMMMFWWYWW